MVRVDEVYRCPMMSPGVGCVMALTYRATVDVLAGSENPSQSGRYFGLRAPSINRARSIGAVEHRAAEMMRVTLKTEVSLYVSWTCRSIGKTAHKSHVGRALVPIPKRSTSSRDIDIAVVDSLKALDLNRD